MLLLCSPDMKSNTGKIFRDMGLKIIDIPKSMVLSEAVSSHPDMLFSVIDEKTLLTDKSYYNENKTFFKTLEESGVKILCSEQSLSGKYPGDVLFDAIKTEKLIVGRLDFTAKELFSEKIKAFNVKQGYALCSTLLLKGAAVTADKGICRVLENNGYDVLKISEGGIKLDGYDYGFIGGASAVLETQKTVVFFGNVKKHKDGERILAFCEKHGYKTVFSEEDELSDMGGVKVIYR